MGNTDTLHPNLCSVLFPIFRIKFLLLVYNESIIGASLGMLVQSHEITYAL